WSCTSTSALVVTSPATRANPLVSKVSTATRATGSWARMASRTLSLTRSASLSGCPSVTDSAETNLRMSVYSHMAIDTVGVAFRRAREGDARSVTALLTGIYGEWRYFVGDAPGSERNLALRIAHDDPSRSYYCVATSGGSVVGWAELHRSPAWRLEHVAVLTLAVAPPARRQGVGRGL